jgi:hypothetical protein
MTAKAKVESAVQIVVEREILAPLRQEHFTSLAKVNYALAYARKQVNNRSFQKLAGSRRSVFEELERAALRPLLPTRYKLPTWTTAKVNIDYHVAVEKHFYSVPYALARREGRRAAHGDGRRNPPRRQPGRGPRPQYRDRVVHDRSGAPSQVPSAASRVVTVPPHSVGQGDRTGTDQVVTTILARLPHPEPRLSRVPHAHLTPPALR